METDKEVRDSNGSGDVLKWLFIGLGLDKEDKLSQHLEKVLGQLENVTDRETMLSLLAELRGITTPTERYACLTAKLYGGAENPLVQVMARAITTVQEEIKKMRQAENVEEASAVALSTAVDAEMISGQLSQFPQAVAVDNQQTREETLEGRNVRLTRESDEWKLKCEATVKEREREQAAAVVKAEAANKVKEQFRQFDAAGQTLGRRGGR